MLKAADCPRSQGMVILGRSFSARAGRRAPPVRNLLNPIRIFIKPVKYGWIMGEDEFAGKTYGEKESL